MLNIEHISDMLIIKLRQVSNFLEPIQDIPKEPLNNYLVCSTVENKLEGLNINMSENQTLFEITQI